MINKFAEQVAEHLFNRIRPYVDAKFETQLKHIDVVAHSVADVCASLEEDFNMSTEEFIKKIADEVATRFRV